MNQSYISKGVNKEVEIEKLVEEKEFIKPIEKFTNEQKYLEIKERHRTIRRVWGHTITWLLFFLVIAAFATLASRGIELVWEIRQIRDIKERNREIEQEKYQYIKNSHILKSIENTSIDIQEEINQQSIEEKNDKKTTDTTQPSKFKHGKNLNQTHVRERPNKKENSLLKIYNSIITIIQKYTTNCRDIVLLISFSVILTFYILYENKIKEQM